MNFLGFEGRGIKVKVTARSVSCLSYCGRRRQPHQRLGVEVLSSLHYFYYYLPYLLTLVVFLLCFFLFICSQVSHTYDKLVS